jgi:hypothetical protein
LGKSELIIDTNLLLLLVIGAVEGGRHISTSNRLNKFTIKDYDLILKIMDNYKAVAITPYIATEVSNLIDLDGRASDLAYNIAGVLFSQFNQINSNIIDDVSHPAFPVFGITDCSLIKLAEDYVILTDDNRLLNSLYDSNFENVLPFEWARTLYRL